MFACEACAITDCHSPNNVDSIFDRRIKDCGYTCGSCHRITDHMVNIAYRSMHMVLMVAYLVELMDWGLVADLELMD